ncbi:MAG: hypothetical protein H0T46_36995 [Deltaproteobacteria bacterium]|nr:hypothetical protein [Deltaproteobacteria bacterium]
MTIDKPILRLLGIGRNSRVKLTTDGRRLVVEPIRPLPDDPNASVSLTQAEAVDGVRVMLELTERYGMSAREFAAFSLRRKSPDSMSTALAYGSAGDKQDRLTMERARVCLRLRKQGQQWDEIIPAAIQEVPTPDDNP